MIGEPLLRWTRCAAVVAAMICVATYGLAQSAVATADATPILPPIRALDRPPTVSSETFGSVLNVRGLRDGTVLVNDGGRRRVVRMDSSLRLLDVALDSATGIANGYGTGAGWLIPFNDDTTLFVDRAALALRVLDERGRTVRIRAVPRTQDLPSIALTSATLAAGMPAADGRRRLVYRAPAVAAPPTVLPPRGVPFTAQDPDSAFVIAVDLDTRKVDTLGVVRLPSPLEVVQGSPNGRYTVTTVPHPLPTVDGWAVTSDGAVAIVRGRDLRIEWIRSDGSRATTASIPYEWQRLSDDRKMAIADSLKQLRRSAAIRVYTNTMIQWVNLYDKAYPRDFVAPPVFVPAASYPRSWRLPGGVEFPSSYLYGCPPGVPQSPQQQLDSALRAMGTGRGSGPPTTTSAAGPAVCASPPVRVRRTPPEPVFIEPLLLPPSALPDYAPPFAEGGVRADADGNLWIQMPSAAGGAASGAVYTIVNGSGELVDRVLLPAGLTLVGFGPGGSIYATTRDAAGLHLVRVRDR